MPSLVKTHQLDIEQMVVQALYSQDKSVISTTNPMSNSGVPTNTQGVEYTALNTTITPKSASNLIKVSIYFNCGKSNSGAYGLMALFKDSDTDAIAARDYGNNENNVIWATLEHWRLAGTTSPIVFKLRFGPSTTSTMWSNAYDNAITRFGGPTTGVNYSSMSVIEYAV